MPTPDAVLARWHDRTVDLLEEMRRDEAAMDLAVPSVESERLAVIRRQAASVLTLIKIERGVRFKESMERPRHCHEGQSALEVLP